jgi:chemotaxis protein methyltransferase CheR
MRDALRDRLYMSSRDLEVLQAICLNVTGFVLRDDFKAAAERKLSPLVLRMGFREFEAYLGVLASEAHDSEPVTSALHALMPHETYFFRDAAQLEFLRDHVVPQALRHKEPMSPLRVWSAGCSTGEEAYTLSMVLQGSPGLTDGCEIVGTDFSHAVLEVARRAEFSPAAVRELRTQAQALFFESLPDGRVRVASEHRNAVHFERVNLIEPEAVENLPLFDVIVCRNVLMYMPRSLRLKVLHSLYGRLKRGGFLLTGHAETFFGEATPFELVAVEGALAYRRPSR